MTTTTKKPYEILPGNIIASDLEYPRYAVKMRLRKPQREKLDVIESYTLHYTERFGWIVATLPISKGRRGNTDRTYGITVKNRNGYSDEKSLVTVGNGPHVLRTISVHVTKGRQKELQWLMDLHRDGMAKAGDTRDRISTRRANTIAARSPFRGLW